MLRFSQSYRRCALIRTKPFVGCIPTPMIRGALRHQSNLAVSSFHSIKCNRLQLTRNLLHSTRRFFSSEPDEDNDQDYDYQDYQEDVDHEEDESSNQIARHSVPCLPIVVPIASPSRPIFPGIPIPMVIQDEAIIRHLSDGNNLESKYVGVFMEKADSNSKMSWGMKAQKLSTLKKSESSEGCTVPSSVDNLHHIGMYAQIKPMMKHGNSNTSSREVLLYGLHRIEMTGMVENDWESEGNDPILRVNIKHYDETKTKFIEEGEEIKDDDIDNENVQIMNKDAVRAYTLEIMSTIREILKLNPLFKEQLQYFLQNADISNPSLLADHAAWITSADGTSLQEILETINVQERVHKSLLLLKKELEINRLQKKISKGVEEKMEETQRKFLLQEQLKSIKRELGLVKEDKESLIDKFRKRLETKTVPSDVLEVINEEMEKISSLENSSMEFNLTRNYLDWLTILPWGFMSKDNYDISIAENVLNEDHYGMEDVKLRILEFIAVGSLLHQQRMKEMDIESASIVDNKSTSKNNKNKNETEKTNHKNEIENENIKDIPIQTPNGKIICLVGPPGVGKTSIGKSIARAINREFFRFSVGGMGDVAEIRGHRRTYVGAMPGKLVQCLKKVNTQNPVILIDEVDKIGVGGHRGDASAALLEVLDPEQNNSFLDHYLDVPIDLSNVLFICTANELEPIPGPLRDRMDFIRLSGYVDHEKLEIVKSYLEPDAAKKTGVPVEKMDLKTETIQEIIRWYCREAGVRNLQQHIEKIYRKAAYDIVCGKLSGRKLTKLPEGKKRFPKEPKEDGIMHITPDNLSEYIGKPKFTSDRLYEETPVGVVMGLAWNSMGGATLYVESSIADRNGKNNTFDDNDIDTEEEEGEELAITTSDDNNSNAGSLFCTGQMGDVMKESTLIAYTVAKSFLNKIDSSNTFFQDHRIHLHVPEGATPKDGPSAGVTMVTSMLSLALNKPINDLGMTGEITLTQKVLPIGGVKEKSIAARRSRLKTLIFPKPNKRDWDELSEDIKEGIDAHFVDNYEEVYSIAFKGKRVPKIKSKTSKKKTTSKKKAKTV